MDSEVALTATAPAGGADAAAAAAAGGSGVAAAAPDISGLMAAAAADSHADEPGAVSTDSSDDDEGSVCAIPDDEECGEDAAPAPEPSCPHSQPLYDGCKLSLFEAVFFLQSFRHEFGVSERAMAALLTFLAVVLPSTHCLPRTLYKLNRVVDADSAQQHIYHVCTRRGCDTGHVWPFLPRTRWLDHKHDKCPSCQGARFTEDLSLGK
jgi:hypothetical protein